MQGISFPSWSHHSAGSILIPASAPHPEAHQSDVQYTLTLQNGVDYWFTERETMQAEIDDGQFLEYAHVHDNIYGTSIRAVKDVASQGKCCILDIDVQGARQVSRPVPATFATSCPVLQTAYGEPRLAVNRNMLCVRAHAKLPHQHLNIARS